MSSNGLTLGAGALFAASLLVPPLIFVEAGEPSAENATHLASIAPAFIATVTWAALSWEEARLGAVDATVSIARVAIILAIAFAAFFEYVAALAQNLIALAVFTLLERRPFESRRPAGRGRSSGEANVPTQRPSSARRAFVGGVLGNLGIAAAAWGYEALLAMLD